MSKLTKIIVGAGLLAFATLGGCRTVVDYGHASNGLYAPTQAKQLAEESDAFNNRPSLEQQRKYLVAVDFLDDIFKNDIAKYV